MNIDWQERTKLLLGDKHQKLVVSNVLVVGVGGVGGVVAEMLCRAGVGKITIVDGDKIDITNLNRQIFTSVSSVDKSKAYVLGEKLLSINSDLELIVIDKYIKDYEMVDLLKSDKFDYVVDAIDTLSPKVSLINSCFQLGLNIVSSMGSGGKLNPSLVEVADISKSYNCPLARIVRKRLHGLGVRSGVKVVFSPEKRVETSLKFVEQENKKTTLGTISYMPSIFGIYAAWVVIDDLTNI
ncbi:MAG: tRNA threonylcarbamoyladenosine dehydratase [Bacteroidales bacterium]|nr:tRNA threonylcarbamoyladenosine dehydratase [Bacteroidales bacterium]